MADPRGPDPPSRRDLPGGSVYPAEIDEGSGQAGLYPVLHLFHLANTKVGAGSLSARTRRLSRPRLLSPQFLRKYPRYPALPPAGRRTMDVQITVGAGGHAVQRRWHL